MDYDEQQKHTMITMLCSVIYTLFDKHADKDSTLNEDLGLDSLDRVDILSEMEEKLGFEDGEIDFTKEQQEKFAQCKTVKDLAVFFLEIKNAKLQ